MTPTTLREFVELWQKVHECDVKPSVLISQKFKNCEDDKLEVYEGRFPINQENYYPDEGWTMISTRKHTSPVIRMGRTLRMHRIYVYKRIAPRNTVNFQLKPPVKSYFTGIYGPYKSM